MKCLSVPVFLIISLLLPSVCHSSFSVPPLEETVCHCKEFLNTYKDSKENFESLKPDKLVPQYIMCNQSAILNKLTAHEKKLLESISVEVQKVKHELPPELIQQLEQMSNYFNSRWEQGYKESYTNREINEFDTKLKIIWQEMLQALSENNIEKAVSYFHDRSQASYRKQFTSFSSETRKKIADEMSMSIIKLEDISGERARYHLITERDGKRYSFQLTFIRNLNGEWKILSY